MNSSIQQYLEAVGAEAAGAVFSVRSLEPAEGFSATIELGTFAESKRKTIVNFSSEWLEAVLYSPTGRFRIFVVDDFSELDAYTYGRVAELLAVVVHFLNGGGEVSTSRTLLGRRKSLRIWANGREWVAR